MAFQDRTYYSDNAGFSGNAKFTGSVRVLIIINIVVFILINLFRDLPWFTVFGLVPSFVTTRLMLWQPLTYLFLHAGLWHLVLNMLMLWMFGTTLESIWGRHKFLSYYFFTGVGAGICSCIFAYHSLTPVVGASGSIFGLLVAYALMFPETIILLFFIFPIKMKYAAMIFAGINLLGALSNPGNVISYIAHLGGGLFGYLYFKNEWIKSKISRFSPTQLREAYGRKKVLRKQLETAELNIQIDIILDKISQNGMESLTPREKHILKQSSKKI